MYLETIRIPNGDIYYNYRIYKCDHCGTRVEEAWPHTDEQNKHFCWDCSFITGRVTESEYLKWSGIGIENAHASVREGKVVIWVGKRPPWELTNKDLRNSGRYREWRNKVFIRDDYTCQHCNQRGGELNAHHIKQFAKYVDLRFEVSNGLTLCVDCHKKVHREG